MLNKLGGIFLFKFKKKSHLSVSKLEELNATELDKIRKHKEEDLVGYILSLRSKVDELESLHVIAKQVHQLQRGHVRSLQYNCRENIELHGIPESLPDNQLEAKCVEILHEIWVQGCYAERDSRMSPS